MQRCRGGLAIGVAGGTRQRSPTHSVLAWRAHACGRMPHAQTSLCALRFAPLDAAIAAMQMIDKLRQKYPKSLLPAVLHVLR